MQEYRNDKIVVRYDPEICIHAGECVRGLPSVFNVSKIRGSRLTELPQPRSPNRSSVVRRAR